MPSDAGCKNWYFYTGLGNCHGGYWASYTGYWIQENGIIMLFTELIGASSYAQVGLSGVRVVRRSWIHFMDSDSDYFTDEKY